MTARMGKKMRRKKLKVPTTHFESSKMYHEGLIAGEQSRRTGHREVNTKEARQRKLRLARKSAEMMAKGLIGMNLAKKRAKKAAEKKYGTTKKRKTTKRKRK